MRKKIPGNPDALLKGAQKNPTICHTHWCLVEEQQLLRCQRHRRKIWAVGFRGKSRRDLLFMHGVCLTWSPQEDTIFFCVKHSPKGPNLRLYWSNKMSKCAPSWLCTGTPSWTATFSRLLYAAEPSASLHKLWKTGAAASWGWGKVQWHKAATPYPIAPLEQQQAPVGQWQKTIELSGKFCKLCKGPWSFALPIQRHCDGWAIIPALLEREDFSVDIFRSSCGSCPGTFQCCSATPAGQLMKCRKWLTTELSWNLCKVLTGQALEQ